MSLIGVCLEEQEKILVYEFMPNRSLDTILFGTTLSLFISQKQNSHYGQASIGAVQVPPNFHCNADTSFLNRRFCETEGPRLGKEIQDYQWSC